MSRTIYYPSIQLVDDNMEFMLRGHAGSFLYDMATLFSPRKTQYGWARVSTPGNLNLWHYGCGLHDVSVYASGEGYKDSDGSNKVRYNVRFRVGNADDGSWGAWGPTFDTMDECLEHVDKVAPILDDLLELPTEAELNEMLRPFGMFGEFEG